MLTLPAPAKVNLFLHVVGRFPDGYHRLQTYFQLLDLVDEVALAPAPEGVIELTEDSEGPRRDNLVVRAAARLREAAGPASAGAPPRGARIRLRKGIPAGGGLGGGSSDAATTLVGLNRLWGLGLGEDRLAELGLALGADVPVFVRGRSAFGEGRGERLTALEPEAAWYTIVTPPVAVSTAEVFGDPELTRDTPELRIRDLFRPDAFAGLRNDCQPVTERRVAPVRAAVRGLGERLARHGSGAGWVRMSGTGASVFARVRSRIVAADLAQGWPDGWFVRCARGLARSPLFTAGASRSTV